MKFDRTTYVVLRTSVSLGLISLKYLKNKRSYKYADCGAAKNFPYIVNGADYTASRDKICEYKRKYNYKITGCREKYRRPYGKCECGVPAGHAAPERRASMQDYLARNHHA